MTETIEPDPSIMTVLEDLTDRKTAGKGIRMLSERSGEFTSRYEMMLAGAAMVPSARDTLNDALTEKFAAGTEGLMVSTSNRELVIGAGYSAAAYCAVRARMGKPKPVVVDMADPAHIGGAFAVSTNPVFRLNSGNRPGRGGLPGDLSSSLNYIPGAVIQPADFSGDEYQTNTDMALAIRLALAQFADVRPGTMVTDIDRDGDRFEVNGEYIFARVIDARGLGQVSSTAVNGTTVVTFSQFMRRMGEELFPLRGVKNMAVIGGGDAGKCVVESAMGTAPSRWPARLDFVSRVDWYDRALPATKDSWKETQRGRYLGLCKFLGKRVFINQGAGRVVPVFNGGLVNGTPYDLVVVCTGNTLPALGYANIDMYVTDDGTARIYSENVEFYRIGVAADIPFTRTELDNGISRIPANKVAMFRNGPRIAALASSLD